MNENIEDDKILDEALDVVMNASRNADFDESASDAGKSEIDVAANEELADGLDEDVEIDSDDEDAPKRRTKYVTGAQLYDIIIKHPDWRVVQASKSGSEWMTPIDFVYDMEEMRFIHDATSTQYHPHGLCEDIIDLMGPELPEALRNKPVIVGGLYIEDWDAWGMKVLKTSLDQSAKWIKLHVEDNGW